LKTLVEGSYHKSGDILIVTLEEADIKNTNLTVNLQEILNELEIFKIVLDMSKIEFILSGHIDVLEKINRFFKITNTSVIFSGFSISTATMLFHFVESVSFRTALNVEEAIHEFKAK
jgi:hypothetical protein